MHFLRLVSHFYQTIYYIMAFYDIQLRKIDIP